MTLFIVNILYSHEDTIKPGRLWSFLISAVCHLKALQVSGYFGAAKLSTPKSLGDQETMMGRLLVHLLCLMQFNTHGVAESTDRWDTRVMVGSLNSYFSSLLIKTIKHRNLRTSRG